MSMIFEIKCLSAVMICLTILVAFGMPAFTSTLFAGHDYIQTAHATHVSIPVIATDTGMGYFFGDDLVISGWVDYSGSPASDVLLNLRVTDPRGISIAESFVTSGPDGEFSYALAMPSGAVSGEYLVNVTSMCRDEHRQICQYKSTNFTVHMMYETDVRIPPWVRALATFWINDDISDDAFAGAIEYLVSNHIVVISYSDGIGADAIPDVMMVKERAALWVSGKTTDFEFAKAIARIR